MKQPTEEDDYATSGSSTDADAAGCGNAGGPVDLPLHLTEKILRCINPLESARIATVCKSWAATVSERLARPAPHLFISLPADNTSDRRGLVVPIDGGGARMAAAVRIPNRVRLADTNGLSCVGAMPSGHLAFANWWWGNDNKLVLVNPITGARQSIDVGEPRRNPVLAAGDGDSFISVGADRLMLCWRAGGGEEWSKRTVEAAAAHWAANLVSAAMCNGCFYMLDKGGYVFTVDVAAPPPLRMKKLPVASVFDRLGGAAKGQLLAADGEVLFVRPVLATREFGRATILCRHDTGELHSIVGFEVYRLDVKDRRWTKVEKLAGDRTLFVSPESTFVVRSSETEGCRSNCIYFVGKAWYCSLCNRDDGNTWGIYSMEDRKVLYEHAVTGTGLCSRATWFLPNVA
ncbi:hypothetical protein BS78_04G116200 [Paspalum vaginatum]|nr:hypothetical protein BS78_04G116200 [Paspalum vaginatum]KAJ1278926.1 hypothetical protein BS78_04G116200 [Paspalum vaginatum]